MAFDLKQLWQLSILETAGIATVVLSAAVLGGVVYSIWRGRWHKLHSSKVSYLHRACPVCVGRPAEAKFAHHRITLGHRR